MNTIIGLIQSISRSDANEQKSDYAIGANQGMHAAFVVVFCIAAQRHLPGWSPIEQMAAAAGFWILLWESAQLWMDWRRRATAPITRRRFIDIGEDSIAYCSGACSWWVMFHFTLPWAVVPGAPFLSMAVVALAIVLIIKIRRATEGDPR